MAKNKYHVWKKISCTQLPRRTTERSVYNHTPVYWTEIINYKLCIVLEIIKFYYKEIISKWNCINNFSENTAMCRKQTFIDLINRI